VRLRFPLYAKILLWFFLNLVLLGGAFLLLVRAQFHFGLDWLLAAGAAERIQAISDVIVSELNDRPRSDWNTVLKRFDDAYQVQFLIYHGDGNQLAGATTPLPPEVRMRSGEGRVPPGFRPPLDDPALQGQPSDRPDQEGGRPDRPGLGPPPWRGGRRADLPPGLLVPRRGPFPKFIVRTTEPTRYWLVVRAPINDPERRGPLMLVALSHTMSAGGLFFDFRPWLAVALGAVVFSALLWAPLVRGITRSIAQMTQTTRQIAEGRFEARTRENRRDELGLLGQSINRMAARLSGFVTGQKRFLGDVAHELCSPLARIQVALGILEQRADEKQQGYVDDVREEVQHMSSLVNELLSFSKASLGASTLKLQPVLVREVVEKAVSRENTDAAQIRVELADDLSVLAEPELLVRSLSNLLRNAIRYAGQAGPITVSARRENGTVVLTVADWGPGVPEAELAQIFDPFYRLDSSRDASTGGVGLGLAIVKTCIESCRGTVACRNRQPSGLEVELRLPSTPDGPQPTGIQNP
jgi:two-component system, OmpR family, sensor histidine kinase CpxA